LFPTKRRYYPRNLAVASTRGKDVYEFLVVWNHEIPSLPRILEVFSKHKAKVLLAHSQVEEKTGSVIGTFFYDLAEADEDAEGIRKEIKKLSFVRDAEVASTENSLFDKFLFPVTVWGQQRVLVMRLNPLLNIESRLKRDLGSAGLAIMFREGEGYATETVAQYREVLGSVTRESLLENIIDGLRATGWGIFEFRTTKEGYEVIVQEAPVIEGMTEPSRFVCGIVGGVIESVYGIKVKVVESDIDRKSGEARMKFEKTPDSPQS
jgi:hypothetical protein